MYPEGDCTFKTCDGDRIKTVHLQPTGDHCKKECEDDPECVAVFHINDPETDNPRCQLYRDCPAERTPALCGDTYLWVTEPPTGIPSMTPTREPSTLGSNHTATKIAK